MIPSIVNPSGISPLAWTGPFRRRGMPDGWDEIPESGDDDDDDDDDDPSRDDASDEEDRKGDEPMDDRE